MDTVLWLDDGVAEVGVRTDGGPFMAWLNGFAVDGSASIIDAIDVMFVFMPTGTNVGVHVWSDPNGDGDPTDAQALWSGQYVVQQLDTFVTINVPDLDLGPANTRFFVGFTMPVTANDFPAAMDTQASNFGQSWIVGDTSPLDVNDLSSAAEFGTIDDLLFPGNWLIRARMLGGAGDCNVNGIPDVCDIAAGTLDDVDGNGVPDDCEDCNGNGTPDGLDIAGGTSLDCQGDGLPDECPTATATRSPTTASSRRSATATATACPMGATSPPARAPTPTATARRTSARTATTTACWTASTSGSASATTASRTASPTSASSAIRSCPRRTSGTTARRT
jgi:hypothetical protein